MDQERFDFLARGLASGATATRHGLIRTLAGAAVGGVLVAVGTSEAGARKKKKKKRGGGNRKPRQSQCTSCSADCPGAAENTPTKTISFAPTGDANYCSVIVDMTGFAGCTSYGAEYWIRRRGPENLGDVTLGPTDLSGSSQTNLGTYGKHGEVDIRINGVATAFSSVDC